MHGFGFNKYQNKFFIIFSYLLELFTSLITSKYICVSQLDINTGHKLFPKFKTKSKLIRAGISDNYLNNKIIKNNNLKFNLNNKNYTFGTIACFKAQKNLFDLLKAFNKIIKNNKKNINYKLEIIGDGELKNKILDYINNNNLNNYIILHGWQEENNIIKILANWNCFVLSSLWEGLPCSIIEARALKLPVISYNTGGIPEVIFNNLNGFLCEQNNWNKLSDYMLKISIDKNLYHKLSEHPDNLNQFSYKTMLDSHMNLYKNL